MYKENNKITIFIFITMIFCLFVSLIVLTYSYFSAFIIEENQDAVTKVLSVGLEVTFNDTEYMYTENFKPGDTYTKTFTVENTSVKPARYDVIWDDLTNTFINNELTYEVSCVSYFKYGTVNERIEGTCSGKPETVVPVESKILMTSSQLVDPNMTHVYTLTIRFKEIESNQNYNQRALLLGKVEIISGREDRSLTALYVNSKKITELDEDEIYILTGYECSEGEAISYFSETRTISITPFSSETNCSVYFSTADQAIYDFGFIADDTLTQPYIQTFTAPGAGIYKLETWGAGPNGKGGYSVGYIGLDYNDKLYVVVGGTNGLNGGNNGGGGATHIATMSIGTGFLYELIDNQDSVLIVSGAGGAGGYNTEYDSRYNQTYVGGYGGGESGGGSGGTQTAGGAGISGEAAYGVAATGLFGRAGISCSACSGGGGGWYGGGGGGYSAKATENYYYRKKPGGGGSGYVKSTLTDAYTYAGNFSFLSPTGTSETGHSGNGFARITYVGNAH